MLIGASLKMYFSHARTISWVSEVAAIVAAHPARGAVTAFVIPQYPSIPGALDRAGDLLVGAQDVATEDSGAFTGEVSAAVLAELGCRFVEVGHAERRRMFGDTDAVVAAKTHAAIRNGLVPIVCVGEAERVDADTAASACIEQIRSALAAADDAGVRGEFVIAYEPLWAIGAPAPAADDHIRGVCTRLRAHLRAAERPARVIYGGSAGPGLLTRIADSVDGLFLGRFAHEPGAVRDILDEVGALTA
ncbi:triose-phosphate isomerase family protein [Microbacterium sp. ZW T5_56]|uniref:triose-phosphate isomerase family protein n=1 Tax=Microbacterium sp. ZW T5_56 TaxID=3378081 RepID=UPI003852F9E5